MEQVLSLSGLYLVGDLDNIWLGGSTLEITSDGGVNWTWDEQNNFRVRDIDLLNGKDGFVLHYINGYGTNIYYTQDTGINWTDLEINGGYILNAFNVFNHNNIWIVGNDGVILKYAGIINSLEQDDNNFIHKEFDVCCYPNPFNPSTTIKYQLTKEGLVTIKVYNILGKEIAVIVEEHQAAGAHSVEFNASHLSSGVYIYTINANGFVKAKKMILAK